MPCGSNACVESTDTALASGAAVIIAPAGDYQSDITLLKIGNYQLLRYRMLDQSIEVMLDKINDGFGTRGGSSHFPAGLLAWFPADTNLRVPNASDQQMKLMVLEFNDTHQEEEPSVATLSDLNRF
jgi:hypothetical protein